MKIRIFAAELFHAAIPTDKTEPISRFSQFQNVPKMEKSETHGWQQWIKMENQRYLIVVVGSDAYTWKNYRYLKSKFCDGTAVQVLKIEAMNTFEITKL